MLRDMPSVASHLGFCLSRLVSGDTQGPRVIAVECNKE